MEQNRTKHFASDNYSGICPEAFEALQHANNFHARAYGDDEWTARAADKFRELFETTCEVFFVFNGTAANSLALSAICQSYHSIICHELAHIETDECGAPEFFSNGAKLLCGSGADGKLTPAAINAIYNRRSDIHFPKPQAVSITQATEVGTVYSVAELGAIADAARHYNLRLHMDGARFANAIVSLGVSPAEMTWKSGVDVLCFGGVKNGLAMGEAVIFFDKQLAVDFDFRCKQAGQLCSKMRFMAAPWLGLLENGVWLKNADNANRSAQYLYDQLSTIEGVRIMFPCQANALFVEMPDKLIEQLHDAGWSFYTFIGVGGVRLMTSWDTDIIVIDDFVDDVRRFLKG